MLLNEALNKPYPYEIKSNGKGKLYAVFETINKIRYEIH